MFQKFLWLCPLVSLVAVLSGCEPPPPAPEKAKVAAEATGDELPPPRVTPRDGRDWYYKGVVGAVGPDWLELAPGWEGMAPGRPRPDTTKPKRLDASGTQLGGDSRGLGPSRDPSHYVRHVQVGDRVEVVTRRDRNDENEFVTSIQIRRRPGGLIPPMIAESTPEAVNTEHLRDQADQDWEEKGIPIPKKYLGFEGRTDRTNPPYPLVAPAPRPKAETTP